MFSFLKKVFEKHEPCTTCGEACIYEDGEEKNYVSMKDADTYEFVESLICKSCAKFFEEIDRLKKELDEPGPVSKSNPRRAK